jgi:L-alanine-DL-glutamate epimerase-like enolase superfamily enzyme
VKLENVTVRHVHVPTPRPLRTGSFTVTGLEFVLVEVTADGVTGSGYAKTFVPAHARAVQEIAADLGQTLCDGRETGPRAAAALMADRVSYIGRSGAALCAISAIDTALWDVLAQQAGQPLFRLLGGDDGRLPIYASGGWLNYTRDELAEEAERYWADGYRRYKIKVGYEDSRVDVERVAALREDVPDGLEIMVDANQAWKLPEALRAGRALQDLGVRWFEEPVAVSDRRALHTLVERLDAQVATGETLFGAEPFVQLLDEGAADVVMPDLMRAGGITGLLDVLQLAQTRGIPVSSHAFTEMSAHAMAACGGGGLVEHIPGWSDELFELVPEVRDGHLLLTEDSGTGVRFAADVGDRLGTGEAVTVRAQR